MTMKIKLCEAAAEPIRLGMAFIVAGFLSLVSQPSLADVLPDFRIYTSPTRLVDIGGRRLNIVCTGSGSPTVVFESGLGSPGWDWVPVHNKIAQRTRACVYDRAGLGFSDPATRPGTTANAADDLALLLRAAGERPPYVLVGASYGSMIVRMFAARNPVEVSGLVLVDGHHEDEFARINQLSSGRYAQMIGGLEKSYRDCAAASRRGMLPGSDLFKECAVPAPSFADRKLAAAHLVQLMSREYWKAPLSEMENIHGASSDQMRVVRDDLSRVPVLALIRSISPFSAPGKPPSAVSIAVEQDNVRMQQETAARSIAGRTRIVANASHAIHIDNPAAVVAAVLEFVP